MDDRDGDRGVAREDGTWRRSGLMLPDRLASVRRSIGGDDPLPIRLGLNPRRRRHQSVAGAAVAARRSESVNVLSLRALGALGDVELDA